MDTNSLQTGHTQSPLGPHLANVAENLQLIADLGYGDVTLAIPDGDALRVAADARPVTAVAAVAASRAGQLLARSEEPEAYDAFEHVAAIIGTRRRSRAASAITPLRSPS